jgi:phosphatidate cytidylyltransferase
MLKQRIITAVLMLLVLLPALFAQAPWPFALLTLVMIAAAGWEWFRLNGAPGVPALAGGVVVAAGSAAMWQIGWIGHSPGVLWQLALLLWVLGGAWVLRRGVAAWPQAPSLLRLAGGVLLLWLAWLAIAEGRARGLNFLLSVFCLVWMADIAAYFAGRKFGLRFTRAKLAPSISPGKSWAGVWGGVAGVLLLALGWVLADAHFQPDQPSFYTVVARQGWWMLLVVALFMTAMSVAGDLVESLIKRSAGVKDSSQLLPGHGGVLDRVDALLPTLPLALMITTLLSP